MRKLANTISRVGITSALLKPLLITIIIIVAYRLGLLIPIPFGAAEGSKELFGISSSYSTMDCSLSIFILGIMPYVTAFILVEIFSLCIPFLKRLRSGDYKGRLKLKRISLVLALPLAILQANGLIMGLKSLSLPDGQSMLNVSNSFEHLFLIFVLVGSFYLLVGLCGLISRLGIGHGISIIILSGIGSTFISRVAMHVKQFEYSDLFFHIIAVIVTCGIVSLAYVLLKAKTSFPCYHEKDNTTVDYFQLNMSPSSTVALTYAAPFIMLPATLSHFFSINDNLANHLYPGSIGYNIISILFVFIFSFLLGWAFLHPVKRVKKMRGRGWHFAEMDTAAETVLLKKQFMYNLPWAIFLCIMIIVPSLLISSTNIPFYIGGSSIIVIVAISLDLIGGFRFYQNNPHRPIKIAEFHDIYDANMIQNHMEAVGIKSYLPGYHHRLLRYFFGPYLEMSLIIDEQDKDRAQTLIQDFYSGLGLLLESPSGSWNSLSGDTR